jgi:hypothetical protein
MQNNNPEINVFLLIFNEFEMQEPGMTDYNPG